jgi:hypothetical protein
MAVLVFQLATPPAQPQAAGVPASDVGLIPISGVPVITINPNFRPPEQTLSSPL